MTARDSYPILKAFRERLQSIRSSLNWRTVARVVFRILVAWLLVTATNAIVGNYAVQLCHTAIRYCRSRSTPTFAVAVVVPFRGSDTKGGRELYEAVRYAKAELQHKDEYSFLRNVTVERKDDHGDGTVARERAMEAVEDADVVGVIGHFSSSVTREVLGIYGKGNMPIIMPVPTSSTILAEARNRACQYALRLPPSNEKQGGAMASFVLNKLGARTAVVLRGQSNAEWSNDLADHFVNAFEENGRGKVIVDMAFGGRQPWLVVTDSMKMHCVDVVLIAGMTYEVLLGLRQAKSLGWQPKKCFLLGDGAVSEDILVRGGDVLGTQTVFAFQLPEVKPAQVRGMYNKLHIEGLSFAPYGYDSFLIYADIMQRIRARGERISRRSVGLEMKCCCGSKSGIKGSLGDYRFDRYGNNTGLNYHFYVPDLKNRSFTHHTLCCHKQR